MSENDVSKDEIMFVRAIFKEMRDELKPFCTDRNFVLSNSQIFTFLTFAPNALAIASDGTVDEKEMQALEIISKSLDVKSMVNLDLAEKFAYAAEPEGVITNEEFNIIAGTELLYLCRNMTKYESNFVNAVKSLLKFDFAPQQDTSMTKSFLNMMDSIIDNNISKNKEEEKNKLSELQKKLGIAQYK